MITNNAPIKKINRSINYLNRDFAGFRNELIKYAETYYPNSYKDFNESSLGMMFMEMASYVGDVLGFYIDQQAAENILSTAQQRKNVILLAQSLGYVPKLVSPSFGYVDVYMTVDALADAGNNYPPDLTQALKLKQGINLTGGGSSFVTIEPIDFTNRSKLTYQVLESVSGIPQTYMLKTQVKVQSGNIVTTQINTGATSDKYKSIEITDSNFIDIVSVVDESNREWKYVPFLAQDTVYVDKTNLSTSPMFGDYSTDTPYLLSFKKEPRRFTIRINSNEYPELLFGSGTGESDDLTLIPQYNLYNQNIPEYFDINNFLKTTAYGESPTGILTITYLSGNGFADNVSAGTIDTISNNSLSDFVVSGDETKLATLAVNNPESMSGGGDGETIEEIKQNALNFFAAQNRAVTAEDYSALALSMPQKYGSVSKSFVLKGDRTIYQYSPDTEKLMEINNVNDNSIKLFCLGYDNNGNLSALNPATKHNLKTYLNTKRMLNDTVYIYDAFVVNVGVSFKIRTYGNFNKSQVLLESLLAVRDYLHTSKMQINQPIFLNEINKVLTNVNGVQSVLSVDVFNKTGGDYSPFVYNIQQNTFDQVVHPSVDPMIFEIKFPERDIEGEVI